MKPLTVQGIVLVLMLLALPLTSYGLSTGTTWAYLAGLVVLALGALTPPVRRFAGPDEDDDD